MLGGKKGEVGAVAYLAFSLNHGAAQVGGGEKGTRPF